VAGAFCPWKTTTCNINPEDLPIATSVWPVSPTSADPTSLEEVAAERWHDRSLRLSRHANQI
jgi:hypothetical protein